MMTSLLHLQVKQKNFELWTIQKKIGQLKEVDSLDSILERVFCQASNTYSLSKWEECTTPDIQT